MPVPPCCATVACMDNDDTTVPAPRRRPWVRPVAAAGVTIAAVAVALVAVAVGVAIEQAANPPNCHGIGWGCTPDPATSAFLAGMIVGAPTVVVGWAATWVGWAVTRTRSDTVNRAAAWWPAWVTSAAAAVVSVSFVAGAG